MKGRKEGQKERKKVERKRKHTRCIIEEQTLRGLRHTLNALHSVEIKTFRSYNLISLHCRALSDDVMKRLRTNTVRELVHLVRR